MLRWFLLLLGCILLVIGFAVSEGPPPRNPLLVTGAVLVVCVLGERWRYRRSRGNDTSRRTWQHTGEYFEDPETGQVMEVLYNPQSGERHYQPVQQTRKD
jgi:membrane protein implicated in regulation of membrane protease activity